MAADQLGDEYTGYEYRAYLTANEYMKRYENYVYDDYILNIIENLALADIYSAAAETFDFVSDIMNYMDEGISIVSGNLDPYSLLISFTIEAAAVPVYDRIDLIADYSNVYFWKERSDQKHVIMLISLARNIIANYETIDREINNAEAGPILIETIEMLLQANSLFYANVVEWDQSTEKRSYQLIELDGKDAKDENFVSPTQTEYDEVITKLLPDSTQKLSNWKVNYDSILSDIENDLVIVENTYLSVPGINEFNSTLDDLSLDIGQSNIEPVPYMGVAVEELAFVNNTPNEITNLNLTIIDGDGLDFAVQSSEITVESGSSASFVFNVSANETGELQRRVKIKVNWQRSGKQYSKLFVIPIQACLPVELVYVAPDQKIYEQGDSVSLTYYFNSFLNKVISVKTELYTHDELVSSSLNQSIDLSPNGHNKLLTEISIPESAPSGFYTVKLKLSSIQIYVLILIQEDSFVFFPKYVDGNMNDVDWSDITIVTASEDEEIAKRLSSALENAEILYYIDPQSGEELTAGELLPVMQTDNLILLGGHLSNLLSNLLSITGKFNLINGLNQEMHQFI